MNLAQLVAKEIVNGFVLFKPEKIRFFGKDKDLVIDTALEFRRYNSEVLISSEGNAGERNVYKIDVDELAAYQKKKRVRVDEIDFEDYWGTDVAVEERLRNMFFKSKIPLNSNMDKIYQIIAATSKRKALKIIPYQQINKKLISTKKEVYVLAWQHAEDERLIQ